MLTDQLLVDLLNLGARFLHVLLLSSDGDLVAVGSLARQVDLRVSLLANGANLGAALANDVFVELFEDFHLSLIVVSLLYRKNPNNVKDTVEKRR